MRAAIYARYSSENQREASIQDQVRLCKEHLEARGWRLVQTYTDSAVTGSTLLRPGIQALMEDANTLAFDVVIVPEDLWNAVKQRQKAGRVNNAKPIRQDRPFWDRRRPRYIFSGLMKCGQCGGSYVKVSANLFGCATARNKGTCDNRLNIRRDVLEASVLNGLKSHLMDPDLFKIFADEFYKEVNRVRMAQSAELAAARRELAGVKDKITRLGSVDL